MNIEKLRNFEPLFGSWYIDKKLSEGRSSVFYRVYRENENGTEFLGLKTIRFPRTEADFNRVMQSGKYSSPEQYLTVLESELRKNMEKMMSLRANANIVRFDNYIIVRELNCFHVIILMEMLKPLSEYLTENMANSKEIAKMGYDLALALEGFRKQGIMHREIKPENIFVDDIGTYKLGDFGISNIGQLGDKQEEMSNYLAPEVLYSTGIDTCSDIYSLGILMYKLTNNNRVPFLPEYPNSISVDDRKRAFERRMSGERLVKPAKADLDLSKIIFKAAAFRIEERYHTPEQLENDLSRYLFGADDPDATQVLPKINGAKEYKTANQNDIYFDKNAPLKTTYTAEDRAKDEYKNAFDDSDEEEPKNNKKWFALIAVLVIILAVVVFFVVKGLNPKEEETTTIPDETSISTVTEAPTTEPTTETTTEQTTTEAPTTETTTEPTTEAPTTETTTEPTTTQAPTTEPTTEPPTASASSNVVLTNPSSHKSGEETEDGLVYTNLKAVDAQMSLSGDEITAATISLQPIGANPQRKGKAYICQVDSDGYILVNEPVNFGIIYDDEDESSTLACEVVINNEIYYEDNTDFYIVFDEGAIVTDTSINLPFQVKLK
ncbi:MAG: protein kinase [Acutalibacteraceae bacterium]